jgi:hypothetical protein
VEVVDWISILQALHLPFASDFTLLALDMRLGVYKTEIYDQATVFIGLRDAISWKIKGTVLNTA